MRSQPHPLQRFFGTSIVSNCFSRTEQQRIVYSRPSSTTVGSLLRPVVFIHDSSVLRLPLLVAKPVRCPRLLICGSNQMLPLAGGLLRDLRAQGFPPRNPRLLPRFRISALDLLGQTADVGCYPTHVLLESNEGGFCAEYKMVA